MMGGVDGAGDGFVYVLVEQIMANELTQGIASSGLMVLLSWPMSFVGRMMARIPGSTPGGISSVLGAAGIVAGAALGYYTPLPMALCMTIGIGAGLGHKPAREAHEKIVEQWKKTQTNKGAK